MERLEVHGNNMEEETEETPSAENTQPPQTSTKMEINSQTSQIKTQEGTETAGRSTETTN